MAVIWLMCAFSSEHVDKNKSEDEKQEQRQYSMPLICDENNKTNNEERPVLHKPLDSADVCAND